MNLWLCWGSTAHGVKLMKMHQFAFVQKCPALTSTALPPPTPLNVQLTLNGKKVNMSMPPYPISDVGLLTLIWWSGSYQRNVPYDIFATLCRAVHWKYEKYLCTIGRVRRVSFFLLDSTGVLKKLCCGGYKKIILILKISTSIHNECRGTYFTLGLPFTCEIRLSEYKTDDQSNQAYQKNVYIHRLTNDFPVHNRFYRLLMQNRRSTINLSIEKLSRIWWLVSIAVKFSK